MDRIIIIDDRDIRNELEAFLITNREHIRLSSDMDELSLANNPVLDEILKRYEEKYKVKIKTRDNIRFYRLKEIVCMKSINNRTSIELIGGNVHVIDETLDEIENQVKNFPFFRTHCNYLVNMHHIAGIKGIPDPCVIMTHGELIPLSEKQHQIMQNTFEKFIQ